jgi:transitional endoplasmic reticulum ATPase
MARTTTNGSPALDELESAAEAAKLRFNEAQKAAGVNLAAAQSAVSPEILALLTGQRAPSTLLNPDDDIQYHDGTAILVPNGMSIEHLVKVAKAKAEELNKVHEFTKVFNYRPDDGAHAAAIVIKRMFGMSVGKDIPLPFGMKQPPGYKTIKTGPHTEMEVPWYRLEIPALPGAELNLDATMTHNGPVFVIQIESPKKHKAKIENLFREIEQELKDNSIYRGKALMGAHELSFMDTSTFDGRQIVFSDEVERHLSAGLFSLIKHPEATVKAGLPTKRSILAYGPYGTGKSSLGLITAQLAQAHGWTFLSARAGRDKLAPVFKTAALYEPAVVFVEDIDVYTPKTTDKDGISELLDLFDGIGSKNSKIVVVMTTNHIERVPAGMLRPGRLDYCIEIAGLDRKGTEKLIKAVMPGNLISADVDFDAVYAEMEDFQPAWVRAVAARAAAFALDRTNGALTFELTTDDLIASASSLHPQLDLMKKAVEGEPTKEFNDAFGELIRAEMDGMEQLDYDGDFMGTLTAKRRQR